MPRRSCDIVWNSPPKGFVRGERIAAIMFDTHEIAFCQRRHRDILAQPDRAWPTGSIKLKFLGLPRIFFRARSSEAEIPLITSLVPMLPSVFD